MAAPTSLVEPVYSSVACNRTPNCLDWGSNGIVCFGAAHAIALYEPKFAAGRGKLTCTLREHRSRVNCVRWIRGPTPAPESQFVSGAADGTVLAWSETSNYWSPVKLLTKGDGVVSVDGIYWECGEKSSTVVAAAAGNKVHFWWRTENDFSLIDTHSTGSVMVLDVKLHWLPQCSIPVAALACDDGTVRLQTLVLVDDRPMLKDAIKLSGHEDWVRTLAFTVLDDRKLLLASAAQDSLIRVWTISPDDGKELKSTMQTARGTFEICDLNLRFHCQLETVLHGHENWVYGLHFQPRYVNDGKWINPLRLLSCSMDKTMIVWGPESSSGLWMDRVRVGEIGGNTLGFYGCLFGDDGRSILAHGYQGALHLWHENDKGLWNPGVVCSGHFDAVEDLAWEPAGRFLISVSADQTARLHAPWMHSVEGPITWHEIARPQIHGYDLSSIAVLGPFRYASGAEEKIIRVFEAPNNFRANLNRICGTQLSVDDGVGPEGAAVPALGLSNKPVYQNQLAESEQVKKSSSNSDQYTENYFTPTLFNAPPTEETLLQNTLWPEVRKLYGHGYEIFTLASDPQRMLLVSSSRAQKAEHAAILVWNATTGALVDRLEAHTLTVTQMSFSADGQRMVSVSRDRSWAVHVKTTLDDGQTTLKTVATGSGGQRILWSCDWSPDSRYFVTGSRDKRVIVWAPSADDNYSICGRPLTADDSVTAVAFCPTETSPYVVAIGLDDGRISLFRWSPDQQPEDAQWQLIAALNQSQAHHMTVRRLQFRPVTEDGEQGTSNGHGGRIVQLASCGSDNALKIYGFGLDAASAD